MPAVVLPSNLELQVLSVLWHEGPSTVNAVMDSMPDGRERAYTTVLSVMQSLERKGLVDRVARKSRANVYGAAQPQEEILGAKVGDFLTNAFGGRLGEAILALLSAGNLTPEEKTNIERELKRHKAMAAKKTSKKVAKKATKPQVAKKAAKKAAKKVAKKVAKKAVTKKVAKKAAKKAVKKAAKKAVTKPAKKAATKAAKKSAKKAAKKAAPTKKAGKKG